VGHALLFKVTPRAVIKNIFKLFKKYLGIKNMFLKKKLKLNDILI